MTRPDEQAETLPWAGAPVASQEQFLSPEADHPNQGKPAQGKGKLFVAVALIVAAASLTWLVVGGVEQNLVYYLTPSELTAKGDDAIGANVRLGGMVAKDSIRWRPEETELKFKVKDHGAEIEVHASSIPPEMFREGIGVIVEGSIGSDGIFQTRRLMVRHSNEYKAPGDQETVDLDYMS